MELYCSTSTEKILSIVERVRVKPVVYIYPVPVVFENHFPKIQYNRDRSRPSLYYKYSRSIANQNV
jgi:hypothetical protein